MCAAGHSECLGGSLDTAINSTAKKLELVGAMHSGVHQMRVHATLAEISLLNTIIQNVPGSSGEELTCTACHSLDRVDTNRAAFIAIGGKLAQQATAMRPLIHSTAEQLALDAMQAGIAN
jgi:hypothetical protein